MSDLSVTCHYCQKSLDPLSRRNWRRVIGWGRPGRHGGSDIACREDFGEMYACPECVRNAQRGVAVGQESLL